MKRLGRLLLMLGLLSFAPAEALACSSCFLGEGEEERLAYILSTLIMLLLPFVLLGGLGVLLARGARANAEGLNGNSRF